MNKLQCVIASTPFQIISAFTIAEAEGYNTDLYIIGNFKNYASISKKVIQTNVFSNVVTYDLNKLRTAHLSKSNIIRSLCRQISYIQYNTKIKSIALPNRKYEKVYFAAAVSATELLLYFQHEYKPKFVLFDDGVMTYRKLDWVTGDLEKIQYVKKSIYKKIGFIIPDILVYLPALFESMNPGINNVKKLNPLSDKTKEKIITVFDINPSERVKEKIIIIESKVSDYMTTESSEELEKIYEDIIHHNENVIFKRHPRDERMQISDRRYLKGTVPFELYSCIQDMSEKVIFAWDSTAVLTPKMFYNQEPKVVLLYRLVKGKLQNFEETDRLYTEFAKTYESANKFLIPSSYDDLKRIMRQINE